MIVAKVAESAPAVKPPLDCVFIKQRFMAAIGQPEAATRGGPRVSQPAAATARLGDFVSDAAPPPAARARAAIAVLDTVGVTLAGASEPASLIVQRGGDRGRRRRLHRVRHCRPAPA